MSGWIVIPNWDGPEGFQHYKDRTPRWIKNYTELLHDDAYLQLSLVQRGVLHGLWMEYASARRQIPDSTLTVSRRLGQRVTRATLDALNHAGFIAYTASKPLADRYHAASPEKSREEKKDKNHSVLPSTSTLDEDGRTDGDDIDFEVPPRPSSEADFAELPILDLDNVLKDIPA